MFRQYDVHECVVKVDRLTENDILEATQKKTLCLKPKIGNVRLNVSWLPVSSTAKKKSTEGLSALATYRHQNNIVQSVVGKNVKRQRAKFMLAASNLQPSNTGKSAIDDVYPEHSKRNSSLRMGLKPSTHRQLPELPPQPPRGKTPMVKL